MATHRVLAASLLLVAHAAGMTIDFAPAATNGTVLIERVSLPGPGSLDGPKINVTANSTSSDWWYFDAVSDVPGDESTLEIVFHNSGVIPASQPLAVQITGTYSNGTSFDKYVEAAGGATVTVDEEGVRGHWKGADASFSSTPLEKPGLTFTIQVDAPEIGVNGTFILEAVSPLPHTEGPDVKIDNTEQTGTPHYPCGPMVPGVTEDLLPTFQWANAVPDANPTVDMTIDGVPVRINQGFGYHDKNWANVNIDQYAKFWNWGHARFGPYAAVWFNPIDFDDVEHPHAYVLKNGTKILESCEEGSSQVRQWGLNATWPPTTGLEGAMGVEARFKLPTGETLIANLTKHIIVLDEVVHQRANARVRGGIEGGEMFDGYAHFEEFAYGIKFG